MILKLANNVECIIDDEDYERIKLFKWHAFKVKRKTKIYTYLARRPKINGKITIIYLHRFILEINDPLKIVDHINLNTLDNRKCNLRICEKYQNSFNASFSRGLTNKYIGVSKIKNKFRSRIRLRGHKRIEVGSFDNDLMAAEMYDKFALFIRGEFARLNFPEKIEQYRKELKENNDLFLSKILDN